MVERNVADFPKPILGPPAYYGVARIRHAVHHHMKEQEGGLGKFVDDFVVKAVQGVFFFLPQCNSWEFIIDAMHCVQFSLSWRI